MLEELQNRALDELRDATLFHLPSRKVPYFETNQFPLEVLLVFPSIRFDAEEAGKCFALGRQSACVFHLMRIMEVGLKSIGRELNLEMGRYDNWNRILELIQKEVDRRFRERSPEWEVRVPFFNEVLAHLHAVKNAWRNPTMHVQQVYDEERALDYRTRTPWDRRQRDAVHR